jgi:hypothetical protein
MKRLVFVVVFAMIAGILFGVACIGFAFGDVAGGTADVIIGCLALALSVGTFFSKEL